MKVIKQLKMITIMFLLFIVSTPIFAQTGVEDGDGLASVVKIMVAVTAFLIAVILWLVLVNSEKGEKSVDSKSSIFSSLNFETSIEDEQSILLDHDFDGIRELNNKIPPWFLMTFYASMIFAVIYIFKYHILFDGEGDYQTYEYTEEVRMASLELEAVAAESGAVIDENTVTVLDDATSLANGKVTYDKHCVACHLSKGEGLVGPNFTDDYWIHGNKINDLYRIIKVGVPAKGMISWQSQLDPVAMQEVASYILTMRGTNPPNQKDAEGDLYE
ncbi:MAG: cbb3-type cytochrome c oxidase N-terminal domain-containing protein [Melioribacteraceae bacterium]